MRRAFSALEQVRQSIQFGQRDLPACQPRRFAFQQATYLANLADLLLGNTANNGTTIGLQIDDAHAGQGDHRFAYGRVADAKSRSDVLGHKAVPGPGTAREDVAQKRLNQSRTAMPAACFGGCLQFHVGRGSKLQAVTGGKILSRHMGIL